ncbi:MAG: thioesterase family protein [Desulfurellaceae bacterium]|nr:thioesterase family protein [Desulfurellaceae bacterium]
MAKTEQSPSPTPPSHTHTLRVRYAETDQAGMAHHAAYLPWFEEGRVALLRALGKPYRELEAEGFHFPVLEVQCRYRAVALFDDVLKMTTTIEAVGGASIRFGYRLVRPADDMLVAEGATQHACVDDAGKVKRLPRELREMLGRRL